MRRIFYRVPIRTSITGDVWPGLRALANKGYSNFILHGYQREQGDIIPEFGIFNMTVPSKTSGLSIETSSRPLKFRLSKEVRLSLGLNYDQVSEGQ